MNLLRSLLTAFTLTVASTLIAAVNTDTRIFNPNFRTLKVQVEDDFLAPPIIELGSGKTIQISFDEITTDVSYLRYRLIHCNADWQPSALLESEYIDGFNLANIEDYAFSTNTFTHYINYQISIPNQEMQPLVSGNYLLQVFPEDNDEDIILQARFSIADNIAPIDGSASNITDRGSCDKWQQLNFTVDTRRANIQNPFTDLIATIQQNSISSPVHILTNPSRITTNGVAYEHMPALIFPAGNEFRRFETVRADYPGLGVDSTRYISSDNSYHAYLKQDKLRGADNYVYDQTQFGRFKIREYNATDSDLAADYVTVHFSLNSPQFMEADIFIEGEMTQALDPSITKMTYDTDSQKYSLALPLKQGSYNYRYAAAPRIDSTMRSTAQTEGDNYQTRNEYTIKIYHRPPGSRGDRLISYATIYSY